MKLLTILILFLLPGLYVFPQPFSIKTSQISFENKLRPCHTVIYDATAKEVKKGWISYLKNKYSIKIKGVNIFYSRDILSAMDVRISAISEKRLNIYARVAPLSVGSELKFFISFGYDFFIGPEKYPLEFEKMQNLLREFSNTFLNSYYANEISAVLKKIKKIEKGISKKNKDIRKNVRKAKRSSGAVSNALDAKNNSLKYEIELAKNKIMLFTQNLDFLKHKQAELIVN